MQKATEESFLRKKTVYFIHYFRVSCKMPKSTILHSCLVSPPRGLKEKIWVSSGGQKALLNWLHFQGEFRVFTEFSACFTFYQISIMYLTREESSNTTRHNTRTWGFSSNQKGSVKSRKSIGLSVRKLRFWF